MKYLQFNGVAVLAGTKFAFVAAVEHDQRIINDVTDRLGSCLVKGTRRR